MKSTLYTVNAFNSSLIYRVKWKMAMAWWLTLLKYQGIQLSLSMIDLKAFIEISHATINQNISFWSWIFTTWVPWCISLPHIGLSASYVPVVTQCTHAHHFWQKPQLKSPGSKQFYIGQIFLATRNGFASMYSIINRYLHHLYHIPLMIQDVFAYV